MDNISYRGVIATGSLCLCLYLAGCLRKEEVIVEQIATSPDGAYEARVEMHVYGPHFGGETPAVEVHLVPRNSDHQSQAVFSVSGERGAVSVDWKSATQLEINYSREEIPQIHETAIASVVLKINPQ